jgi:hypothetical protein
MSAKLMMVIVTDMECRGKGVEGDPYRRITQYWTPDGKLLVEKDPCEKVEKKTCRYKRVPEGVEFGCCLTIESWEHFHNGIGAFPYCPACGNEIEVVE